MRKFLVSLMFMLSVVSAYAQMTEDKIFEFVMEQQAKGLSQEQIVLELRRKGVSLQQIKTMREKYEKQQMSGGMLGNTLTPELQPTINRTRTQPGEQLQSFNMLNPADQMIDRDRMGNNRRDTRNRDDQEKELLLNMYNESMFMFVDSVYLLKQSLMPKKKEIYGHNIFKNNDLTFEPSTNLATPQNYRLGAGDEVIIDIWGASQISIQEIISPDGFIMAQDLGPVYLSGKTVQEADAYIKNLFGQIYSGLNGEGSNTSIKLSLGQNRSIIVNVMGEVEMPGTYQVSSFSTVFNAIYMAGGVNDLGSLRDIKLYHENEEVATIDMYDYIRNGKVQDDIRLSDNDVVIVSPHSILVNIDGRIRRPMFYEMTEDETLANLIDYAGGLESDAYRKDVRVVRMGEFQREIFTVTKEKQQDFKLVDGDSIYVDSIQVTFANMAEIRGAVYRPGQFQIDGDITTIRQLVEAAGGLKEDAFPSRALLNRTNPDKTLTNLSIDIKGLMEGTAQDETLRNNDILFIPSLFDIGEIKTFSVYGEVLFPGDYRYADNTTIEDLILQAGGLKEDASLSKVDVVRRNRDKDATEKADVLAETFSFSIDENLAIQDNDFRLEPYDEVYVRRSPGYAVNRRVIIEGEVTFPGYYSLATNNERLSDIMNRVGPFSNEAYPEGARLERKMTDDERARMQDIAEILAGNDTVALARALRQFRAINTFDVGINLKEATNKPGSAADIVLRDGDRIIVPVFTNTVKINGEVMFSNTTPYVKGKNLKYYIEKAGGYSQRAKKSKAYVVYMNGSVAKAKKRSSKLVQPGCEIVVPARQERQGLKSTEILSLGSTSASLATVVLALMNLVK
ncbi:MAG: SLBB domain-containing protein [Bacteroidaceae bacterium]|nr:SLBB domain-containing protein [Bacteroidaceae bacterium]